MDSDQLILNFKSDNYEISETYLNNLIAVFDKDGIRDRKYEYVTTIDFVENKASMMLLELQKFFKHV